MQEPSTRESGIGGADTLHQAIRHLINQAQQLPQPSQDRRLRQALAHLWAASDALEALDARDARDALEQ